jgi:chromosome segregation ATPase
MAEAEALLTAVRTLTSDNGYKAIVSLTEEIPPLKRQIESKTKEADGLRAEIVSLKARHQERLQEDLELYRAQHNKVEGENSELSGNISTLERTIREKDRAIAELSRTVKNLQSQLEQSRKSLDKEREKVTTANGEITKLQQGQKDKDIDIEKLKEALRKEQIKVSSAEGKSQDAQTETDSLRQKLKLTTARLSEIEGYTTELREQGEEVW